VTRRLWPSLVLLAAAAALFTAAALADTSTGGVAGTLRLSRSTDIDYVDPALAYFSDTFGMIGYATCARLYNYPDRPAPEGAQPIPEVAAAFPSVSRDGRTVTIALRRSYRFHTGAVVSARSFVDALNRDAHPKMQSPASQYLHELEGADALLEGKAKRISGLRALDRWTLRLRLTKPVPELVGRLTLPFFCPVAPSTSIEPDGINDPAGSGPYYVAERVVNRRIVLARNRFYTGPRRAHFERILWTIGPSLESCRLLTERDETDYCVDGLPPSAYRELAERYGVNRPNGRLFVSPRLGIAYFALNHHRAFRNNPWLAKAVNYALDRPSLVRASGYLGGIRTDQLLPPALARDADLYPLKGPDLERARALARGHLPPDNKLVLQTQNRGARAIRAQLLQYQLKQIGLDLQIRVSARAVAGQPCERRGEQFDICDEGRLVDYPEAVNLFDPLLNGERITETANTNVSYFNEPGVNRRIEQISRLSGTPRLRAWQQLDIDVMRRHAPIAPFLVFTQRDFLSASAGCYLHHPVWGFDLVAACPK